MSSYLLVQASFTSPCVLTPVTLSLTRDDQLVQLVTYLTDIDVVLLDATDRVKILPKGMYAATSDAGQSYEVWQSIGDVDVGFQSVSAYRLTWMHLPDRMIRSLNEAPRQPWEDNAVHRWEETISL